MTATGAPAGCAATCSSGLRPPAGRQRRSGRGCSARSRDGGAHRFGAGAIDELRGSLEAIAERVEVELPEYVPIVDGKDGMAAGLALPETRITSADSGPLTAVRHCSGRPSRAHPSTSNAGRSCRSRSGRTSSASSGWTPPTVRDVSPLAAGVPKEAISMALTFLAEESGPGHVTAEGESRVRLTPRGREAQEALPSPAWGGRKNSGSRASERTTSARLRTAAGARPGRTPRLPESSAPSSPTAGARPSRYLAHTEAMLDDPGRALPAYPMVPPPRRLARRQLTQAGGARTPSVW